MMYEMRRRKLKPTFLLNQGIFNFPQDIGMVGEELVFRDTVSDIQWIIGLQHS